MMETIVTKKIGVSFILPRAKNSGGAEKSFLDLAKYMQDNGIEVKVILLEKEGDLPADLNKLGIEYVHIASPWWVKLPWEKEIQVSERAWQIFDSAIKIAEQIKKWGSDIVYTNTSVINVGAIAAQLINKPHIWHIREFLTKDPAFTPILPFESVGNFLAASSNYVIFNSKATEAEFAQYVPRDRRRVIYNQIKIEEPEFKQVKSKSKVDVVIPFYNDVNVLPCLESIKKYASESLGTVYVIDDLGKDRELARKVEQFCAKSPKLFKYIQNEENKGFVFTCNRGMDLSDNDVILLNTDTLVTKGWVEKLKQAAYQSDDIATVTPLSSSADLFSVPEVNKSNPDKDPDFTNSIVEKYHTQPYVDVPSAHGFCMLIKRAVIKKIGTFDYETFKFGYGEENDFSQRAVAAGYRNIVSSDTYIYHIHGQSFGELKPFHKAGKYEILIKRYPEFPWQLGQFQKVDPLKDIRSIVRIFKNNPELVNADKAIVVGSIEPKKGQLDVIKAVKEIDSLHLILVGEESDPEYVAEIKDYLSKNKLNNRVHFTGFLNNPYSLIKNSQLLVSASQSESFGRSIAEAMLLDVPVVAYNVGGVSELIENNVTGVLVEPGNVSELSAAIGNLINDREKQKTLAKNAKEHVVKVVSNSGQYQEILNIITKLTGAKNQLEGLSAFMEPWFVKEVLSAVQLKFLAKRVVHKLTNNKPYQKYKEFRVKLALKDKIKKVFAKS